MVRATLTVSATMRGQTVYLKIPKDLNKALGIRAGDSVTIGYVGKLYPEPSNPDPEEARTG